MYSKCHIYLWVTDHRNTNYAAGYISYLFPVSPSPTQIFNISDGGRKMVYENDNARTS